MPNQRVTVHSFGRLVGKIDNGIAPCPVVAVFFGVNLGHFQVIFRGDATKFTFEGLPIQGFAGE